MLILFRDRFAFINNGGILSDLALELSPRGGISVTSTLPLSSRVVTMPLRYVLSWLEQLCKRTALSIRGSTYGPFPGKRE
jgi:hypothetical protein